MELIEKRPRHLALANGRPVLSLKLLWYILPVFLLVWLVLILTRWPFTRTAVTKAMQQESGMHVQVANLHPTFWPLGYVADDIRLSQHSRETPHVTVRKLVVIAQPLDVLLLRKKVARISIIGLRADIPLVGLAHRKLTPPRFAEIGQLQFEDAVLKFEPLASDPDPLTFTIPHFVFGDVSGAHSGWFAADFSINEPQGVGHASGRMGPWIWSNFGQTPVSGSFAIQHANLAGFGGIEGLLQASGRFSGPLSNVKCSGTARVPDLRLAKGIHAVNLFSAFHASIDGLSGDTTLDSADSRFDETRIEAHGAIKNIPDHPGKSAVLELSVQEGQVADLLLLFTRASQPAMAGTVDLRLKVEIPPGGPGFLKKLVLSGDFGIDRGHFTKPKTQAPINHLSESAEGMGKEARNNSGKTVLSDVSGHLSAHNGIATLSNVSFAMPGAHGVVSGTYDLLSQRVNLRGRLLTTGNLSSTASGVKSFFLKIVTPFFTRHSVTSVPFAVTGIASHPHFGLHLIK